MPTSCKFQQQCGCCWTYQTFGGQLHSLHTSRIFWEQSKANSTKSMKFIVRLPCFCPRQTSFHNINFYEKTTLRKATGRLYKLEGLFLVVIHDPLEMQKSSFFSQFLKMMDRKHPPKKKVAFSLMLKKRLFQASSSGFP